MTDDQRPAIVTDAIAALDSFEITETHEAIELLWKWRRRGEMTVADLRAVLDHYRGARPATEFRRPDDGAPEGAVRALDNDDDEWLPGPNAGTWCCEGLMDRATAALVRLYGPVRWYNAAGDLIATSRGA